MNGIITMVMKAGMAMVRSAQSISLTEPARIRKPTASSAGVAAWDGTMVATGVRNSATVKRPPVTMFARPVRAPSPTPAVDSTKAVVAEEELAPPAATARPSTKRTLLMPGISPLALVSLASSLTPMIVPIASKKHDSRTVKTKRTPVRTPTLPKPPNRLNSPMSPKSGVATGLPGHSGVVRPQDGIVATALMISARTVIATIEMRIAPGTLRVIRASVSRAPRMKTRTGQPFR